MAIGHVISRPHHQAVALFDGLNAIACGDQPTRVWDIASGQELLSLPALAGAGHRLAFRPDGRQIVRASIDVTVREAAASRDE